jgi:lysophospholipase III
VDAKLDKPEVVHYICNKKTDDYFNTWLNLELLVPVAIDCLVSFLSCNSNVPLKAGYFNTLLLAISYSGNLLEACASGALQS